MTLNVGDKAPTFTLPDASGTHHSLADFADKNVIVYFYPKAMTPGCTTQACDFRDNMAAFTSKGYVVIGISPDSGKDLQKFADEENLPFLLLGDESKETLNAYGAFGTKNMYGKEVQGVIRSTFVIDGDGILTHALYNVKATGHVEMLREKLGV
jgi:peroxiredoxin Q/BCP